MLNNMKNTLLRAPRVTKQAFAILIDIIVCAISVQLALNILLEKHVPWIETHSLMLLLGIFCFLPVFVFMGFYRAIFRYTGLHVILSLNKAIAIYFLIYASVFTLIGIDQVPRSVGLLQPLIFGFGIISNRLFVRYWLGDSNVDKSLADTPRVVIYGAGSAGRQLAAGLLTSSEIQLVGFVDDDVRLHGHNLNGLTIYSPTNLPHVVESKKITQIFLAIPSVTQRRRNEVINQLQPLRVQVRTLPAIADLASGRLKVSDLHELNIEDLLGRDPVLPNQNLLRKNISGKVVMVTGAGGSIGSELCRQILLLQPATLLLIELSEFALYEIHRELEYTLHNMFDSKSKDYKAENANPKNEQHGTNPTKLIPLLASVRDIKRMNEIFRSWKPVTVYHAAAYKHVPMVEHNVVEGVKNNLQGTYITAIQAELNGVSDFVLVSTDKAVRPTNIMGTTKRLAEMVLQAKSASQLIKNREKSGKTRFSMVRFGNVLGSSGSVVPLFRNQISGGGPITLTDARMTRYFMTIPEAAQLVIQAAAMATGGDVFVLDMGQPVKILDLAKRMIELSGLTVMDSENAMGDIEIKITGLRPGEKLYEELLIGDNPQPTSHPRIMKAHEDFVTWDVLESKLLMLNNAMEVNDIPLIRDLLKELVSGYCPDAELVDWIWLENERKLYKNKD